MTDGVSNDPLPVHAMPFKALGGQPPFAPHDVGPFLAAEHIAVLAYVRHDGRPNQAPIWYAYDDGVIQMVIGTGSAKHRALMKDPRVCLTVQDERPPYRAVLIDGVVEMRDLAADDMFGFDLAITYFGKAAAEEYWKLSAEDREANGQTLLTVLPSEVKGFDNTKAIGKGLLAAVRLRNKLPIPRRWV